MDHLLRDTARISLLRIAPVRPFPGQSHELAHGRFAAFVDDRVLIGKLPQREAAAPHDLLRVCDGMRMAAEQAHHLRGFLEMAIRTGEATEAQFVDGAAETDGRHDILQRPPLGLVIVDVVGGDEFHTHLRGEIVELGQTTGVVAAEQHGAGHVATVAEQLGQGMQPVAKGRVLGPAGRQHDRQQTLGMGGEIDEVDVALAFFGAPVAQGQQAAEALVGVEVGRIGEQRVAVARFEPAADQQFYPVDIAIVFVACRRESAHDAGQGVAIGDADGGVAEFDRPLHEFLRMRAAAQEAVVGGDLEFGIVHGFKDRREARAPGKAPRSARRFLRSSARAGNPRRR